MWWFLHDIKLVKCFWRCINGRNGSLKPMVGSCWPTWWCQNTIKFKSLRSLGSLCSEKDVKYYINVQRFHHHHNGSSKYIYMSVCIIHFLSLLNVIETSVKYWNFISSNRRVRASYFCCLTTAERATLHCVYHFHCSSAYWWSNTNPTFSDGHHLLRWTGLILSGQKVKQVFSPKCLNRECRLPLTHFTSFCVYLVTLSYLQSG